MDKFNIDSLIPRYGAALIGALYEEGWVRPGSRIARACNNEARITTFTIAHSTTYIINREVFYYLYNSYIIANMMKRHTHIFAKPYNHSTLMKEGG